MKKLELLLLAGILLLLAACGNNPAAPVSAPPVSADPDTAAPVQPVSVAGDSQADSPASMVVASAHRLTVATFNLKFYGDEDDANNREYGDFGENVRRGGRELTGKLAALLDGADVIGLQEVENQAALNNFIKALNEQNPASRYTGYMYDSRLPQDIALVWDAASVDARNAGQIDRRFRVVGYDGNRRVNFARLPLTADFTKNGVAFSVLVVHLKAKSSTGSDWSDARRGAECERLLDWMNAQREGAAREHCMIIGDFNDGYTADGVDTELDPLIDAHRAGRLRFLTADFTAPAQYTNFGFFRRRMYRETIDHIIIPAALVEHYVAGSCRPVMHNDDRLSDHNPVLADFLL